MAEVFFNVEDLLTLQTFDHATMDSMLCRCREPGLASEFLQLHVPVHGVLHIPPPQLQGEKRLLYVVWHFAREHEREYDNKCRCAIL